MDGICKATHARIDERLAVHDSRINNHGDRLDKLEQYQSKSEVQIDNLCLQIKALVITIRWAMGLIGSSLVAFVIWYIQSLPR